MEYKFIEHEADIGLEAYGRTAKEVFANAAKGMFALISSTEKVTAKKSFSVKIEAPSMEDLLINWLNKLLYLYDAEKILLGHFDIEKAGPLNEKSEFSLEATVSGEPIDFKKHTITAYVKAATFHQVKVDLSRGCKIRVIFDV